MRPLVVFLVLICVVHVVLGRPKSEEKASRHQDNSAEESAKPKSSLKETTPTIKQPADSPGAIVAKSKNRKAGSSRKSSRRRDHSSEEYVSKSKRKGGKSRKEDGSSESSEKDMRKINTEQVNFKFWNFENLGNYKNNHNNNGNDNGPKDNSDSDR